MISRREFLRGSAIMGAAAVTAVAFAGCSGSRGDASVSTASSASSAAGTSSSSQASSTASSQASAASAAASQASEASEASQSASQSTSASESVAASSGSSSIVVYFSRAGENYGVGTVQVGNTAIVADMVAELTGSNTFEIVPAEAYPEGYDECCDVALDEQNAGARPAYAGDIDLSAYDTVYLGYPIWWGDLPMCVYTFLESHDWSGKEIRPFCTHAGSGLSGTETALRSTCAGATVASGLAISGTTAQNSRDEARASVESWLA